MKNCRFLFIKELETRPWISTKLLSTNETVYGAPEEKINEKKRTSVLLNVLHFPSLVPALLRSATLVLAMKSNFSSENFTRLDYCFARFISRKRTVLELLIPNKSGNTVPLIKMLFLKWIAGAPRENVITVHWSSKVRPLFAPGTNTLSICLNRSIPLSFQKNINSYPCTLSYRSFA